MKRPRPAIATASLEEWESVYSACEDATFFHSPGWSLTWQDYSGGTMEPSPRKVTLPDGQVAVLGVTIQRTRLGRAMHHLSPAGVYGGWVSADRLQRAEERMLVQEILRLGLVSWRIPPRIGDAKEPVAHSREEWTHLVDLRDGADAARDAWSDSARRRARRATRSGVIVRDADGDEAWRSYDQLYRRSLERWGSSASSSYRADLWPTLRRRGGKDVRLFLAEFEGSPAAGAVILTKGARAVYWHGASDPTSAAGASNLLQWEIIGMLAAEGRHLYDLNPSGGHEGANRFKETLGAVRAPAPLIMRRDPVGVVAHALASRFRSRRGRLERAP